MKGGCLESNIMALCLYPALGICLMISQRHDCQSLPMCQQEKAQNDCMLSYVDYSASFHFIQYWPWEKVSFVSGELLC